MTEDEWMSEQQRLHNQASYRWPAPKPKRAHRTFTFTPQQLAVAEKWHAKLDRKQSQ